MEFTPELKKALRKCREYKKKRETYRTLFFSLKVEKWEAEAKRLYKNMWFCFCHASMKQQRNQQV